MGFAAREDSGSIEFTVLDFFGNIPEFSPDGINLILKLLPLYANEVIICKFGFGVLTRPGFNRSLVVDW